LLTITHNGWRYEIVADFGARHCQATMKFDARTEARITTSTPMFYDRVLCGVIY